jgi:hypothetical protein
MAVGTNYIPTQTSISLSTNVNPRPADGEMIRQRYRRKNLRCAPSFGIAVFVLYLQQRVYAGLMPFALLDLVLGALFLVAFGKTR